MIRRTASLTAAVALVTPAVLGLTAGAAHAEGSFSSPTPSGGSSLTSTTFQVKAATTRKGTTVTLTNSTISGNNARSSAGVWILGHGTQPAVADLTNVTITGNSTWPQDDFTTRGIGAGITIGDDTTGTILNCTIAGNDAQFGSGILRVTPLVVRNTIISNNAENQYTPLNCTGAMFAAPPGSGEFLGIVSVVISIESLLSRLDVAEIERTQWLSLRGTDGIAGGRPVFYGRPDLFYDAKAVVFDVSLPGGYWQLALSPKPALESLSPDLSAARWFGIAAAASTHQSCWYRSALRRQPQ